MFGLLSAARAGGLKPSGGWGSNQIGRRGRLRGREDVPNSVIIVFKSASVTRPSPSWSIMLNASLNCLTCCGVNIV